MRRARLRQLRRRRFPGKRVAGERLAPVTEAKKRVNGPWLQWISYLTTLLVSLVTMWHLHQQSMATQTQLTQADEDMKIEKERWAAEKKIRERIRAEEIDRRARAYTMDSTSWDRLTSFDSKNHHIPGIHYSSVPGVEELSFPIVILFFNATELAETYDFSVGADGFSIDVLPREFWAQQVHGGVYTLSTFTHFRRLGRRIAFSPTVVTPSEVYVLPLVLTLYIPPDTEKRQKILEQEYAFHVETNGLPLIDIEFSLATILDDINGPDEFDNWVFSWRAQDGNFLTYPTASFRVP